MRILISSLLVLLLCSMDGPKLYPKKITEGVTTMLPKDFYPMSDDDIASKYPSTKKPLSMFTSLDRVADFGLNVTKSKIPANDLNVLKSFYRSTIINMYESVEFLQEDVREVNGRNFIVLEFISYADKTRGYTFLQYALVNGYVYIFNFTCPAHLKDKWQEVAHGAMASLRIDARKLREVEPANPKEPFTIGKNPKQLLEEQNKNKNKKTK